MNEESPKRDDHGLDADTIDLRMLLPRARERDQRAAEILVARLHPLVARIVQGHCPQRDDPADLIQDVFAKMFSRLEQFKGSSPFEHWVARIAHTTCLDALRRRQARPELRWADLSAAEQTLVEATASETEIASPNASEAPELIARLLAQLSPDDAWLLRQLELEERPLAEVCAERGWTAVGGRVRRFRARQRLASALRALEDR